MPKRAISQPESNDLSALCRRLYMRSLSIEMPSTRAKEKKAWKLHSRKKRGKKNENNVPHVRFGSKAGISGPWANVRFGSKADIPCCGAKSALPPKADIRIVTLSFPI
jgi:hypothetical protein